MCPVVKHVCSRWVITILMSSHVWRAPPKDGDVKTLASHPGWCAPQTRHDADRTCSQAAMHDARVAAGVAPQSHHRVEPARGGGRGQGVRCGRQQQQPGSTAAWQQQRRLSSFSSFPFFTYGAGCRNIHQGSPAGLAPQTPKTCDRPAHVVGGARGVLTVGVQLLGPACSGGRRQQGRAAGLPELWRSGVLTPRMGWLSASSMSASMTLRMSCSKGYVVRVAE